MAASRVLPARPSLESIRKQAKKLTRDSSMSLRGAQLALAREYGFPGWQDLLAEVARRTGKGIDAAGGEAMRVIHDNDTGRLKELIAAEPALLSWRDADGQSLLAAATGAFGDARDAFREDTFTRIACAEILIDAGAVVDRQVLDNVITSRAPKMLDLLARKDRLPRTIEYLAALGDLITVRSVFDASPAVDRAVLDRAFINACRFERKDTAAFLLDRTIDVDAGLGARIESGPGRQAFIDRLCERSEATGSPWRTSVAIEIMLAIQRGDRAEFERWLEREPDLLGTQALDRQARMIEECVLNDRPGLIQALYDRSPAILSTAPPPSSDAIVFAFEYAKAHLLPLLHRVWPLPDDLPHAAGAGDFERVRSWFDEDGKPKLGDLSRHHPANHPRCRANLHWGAPSEQQVLDVALAWSCLNRHLDIAAFLLDRGADINTTWSSHEPASILHELVFHDNHEAMRFLIDRGIDLATLDYRWRATAEGWARHAAKNDTMAELLAAAARG